MVLLMNASQALGLTLETFKSDNNSVDPPFHFHMHGRKDSYQNPTQAALRITPNNDP